MSPSPQAVIRLQGVSKVFPDVPPGTPPALSSLTADVPSGLVVGLVGPDAAGKTTLMRLLAGLLLPTSGSVEVLGRVPGSEASDEAVHDVGYMPQRFGLYEDLSVIDNLNLHAELRGLEGPARQAMFEKLLTFTALKPFTDRLAGKLSGGMKQKLGLACALLTTPRLLLLDEPGVGVDPLSRRELWKMVSELAVGGMSVLWSTAYMDEAERCAHVLMLDQGSLVYQGPPAGFTGRVAKRVFSFVPPSGEARAMLARWQQEPDIRDALIQGNRIRVVLRNPHDGPFSRKGVELHPVEPRLEDAYIDAVGGMDQRPSPFLPVSGRGGAEDPGEGRGNFSGERLSPSLPRTPSPHPPKTFDLIESLSATFPETVWRAHGVGKKAFSFLRIWKTFSLLLVSHRETNAKGQPYKPPATPLTLTKIFEEDGVGFGEGKGKLSLESFPFPSPMPHYFTGLNNSQSPAISKGTHKSCPIVSQPKAR